MCYAVDLFDDRNVRQKGFDLIYEARDLDLPQNVRDGLTQARTSLEDTKKRVKASEARIDAELEPFIQKSYCEL
jgi:photosystem II oxygen-evolving enhancer protein 3